MTGTWEIKDVRGQVLASGTALFEPPPSREMAYEVAAQLADAMERALLAALPPPAEPEARLL